LKNQKLSIDLIKDLSKALEKNDKLTKLNLQNTGIDDDSIDFIADMLAINKTITNLELDGNKFEDGIGIILDVLHSENFTILDLVLSDVKSII
jgi:hypothetical protein